MLSKEVVLVGYSGHGNVVAEAAIISGIELKSYTDKKSVSNNYFNLKYLGFEEKLTFQEGEEAQSFILGIGDNMIRTKVGNFLFEKNQRILNVIHPSASISKFIEMGQGNFIARNAAINPNVVLGDFCIINTGSIVEHDCVLESGVHVAPGAVLAGGVKVGVNSFVGANAVIKQGVEIGKNVIIGAGTVIINNVMDNVKIVGNPGRVK